MKRIFVVFFIVMFLIIPCAFSHSGRTDSNGGHYNRSTGEYHYHHGYPAHQHINGVCPYTNNTETNKQNTSVTEKFNNTFSNTSLNATNSSNNTLNHNIVKSNENWFEKNKLLTIIFIITAIFFIFTIKNFVAQKTNDIKEKNTKNQKSVEESNNQHGVSGKKSISNASNPVRKYLCPKCGSPLKIKTGKYGKFIGCSNYPNCKYTRKLYKRK